MPRHLLILGGTGQIGHAVAAEFLDAGWSVSMAARGHRRLANTLTARGARFVALDRDRPEGLARLLRGGADALIDVTAYDQIHTRQLLDVQDNFGMIAVISSSSVYRDVQGRTLDEAARNGFPDFPHPIMETQPTVAAGDATYSTRKIALENILLEKARVPVTILRPAAIHGPGSIHPREWWFIKRMLDGRRAIPLAYKGESRFHTSSVFNIAALLRVALDRPGTRILNIGDPDALSVAEIASEIARCMNYTGMFVPVPTETFPAGIGRSPWAVPRPFLLDNNAALALGYVPVTSYARSAEQVCKDLKERAAFDWQARFPLLATYPYDQFDYQAEDEYLGSISCTH